MLPTFELAPVQEVSVSVQFRPLTALSAAHVGSFWDRLRDKYPFTEDHPPVPRLSVDSPSQLGIQILAANQLPRSWFLSEQKEFLVQLQRDRLAVNWRRLHDAEYPRWPDAEQRFIDAFRLLDQFAKELSLETIQPDAAQVSYVNVVPRGTAWSSWSDLGKVCALFAEGWPRGLPTLRGLSASFELGEPQSPLTIDLKRIIRDDDPSLDALLFQLTASRTFLAPPSVDGLIEVLRDAHQQVVQGFADSTTVYAHNYWKRTE